MFHNNDFKHVWALKFLRFIVGIIVTAGAACGQAWTALDACALLLTRPARLGAHPQGLCPR